MLYIVLSLIILGVTASFFDMVVTAGAKNESINEAEQQGQQALQQILRTIRNAQSISLPTAGTTAASLTLNVYESAASPTVYTVSSGAITICEGAGCTPVELTANNVSVSNLTFSNLSRPNTPGVIKVQFDLDLSSASDRNEYHYPKTFYGTASLRHPQ